MMIQRNQRPAPMSAVAVIVAFLGTALLVVSRSETLLAKRAAEQAQLQMLQQPSGMNLGDSSWASPSQRTAAIQVICCQIAELKSGQTKKAWLCNSVDLRKSLETEENYHDMMVRLYPEIVHSRTIDFGHGRATPDGKSVRMRVIAEGINGKTVSAVYMLTSDSSGRYLINGINSGFQNRNVGNVIRGDWGREGSHQRR